MTQAVKNEIEFLKSFYTLTEGRMKPTEQTYVKHQTIITKFTLEANKLVASNQICQKSLDLFLDEMTLGADIEIAEEKVKIAQDELKKLKAKREKLIQAGIGNKTVVADPCSHPIRSFC